MTVPPPRAHDPEDRAAETIDEPAEQTSAGPPVRYSLTTIYVCLMVTLILFAVLFDWRV